MKNVVLKSLDVTNSECVNKKVIDFWSAKKLVREFFSFSSLSIF